MVQKVELRIFEIASGVRKKDPLTQLRVTSGNFLGHTSQWGMENQLQLRVARAFALGRACKNDESQCCYRENI